MLAVFTYANELGFEPGLDSPEYSDLFVIITILFPC